MEETLKKLISFKTVTDNKKENKKALDFVKEEISSYPLNIKEFSFKGHPSLWASTREGKKAKLILQAHMDVVPGEKDSFNPKIKGKIMEGRGAFDMKFAIAIFLELFKRIELKNHDLALMITSDEETGGFNGVKKLLEMGYSSKVCFLPDGGEDFEIEKAAKGVWHLEVESKGASGHGSRPWLGVNANEKLISFLERLRREFPFEPCFIKDHYHNTLNVGKIEGGEATNQISPSARAFLDIRFIPQEKKKDLERRIEDIRAHFPEIKIKEKVFGEAYDFNENDFYFKTFSEIVSEKIGREPKYLIAHGSSDARFFAKKGIPTILTRPKGGGQHSSKEWIDLEDMKRYLFVLEEFVKKVALLTEKG